MKYLWTLVPISTFWLVFYIGHLVPVNSWNEIPLYMTLCCIFIGSLAVAINKTIP